MGSRQRAQRVREEGSVAQMHRERKWGADAERGAEPGL